MGVGAGKQKPQPSNSTHKETRNRCRIYRGVASSQARLETEVRYPERSHFVVPAHTCFRSCEQELCCSLESDHPSLSGCHAGRNSFGTFLKASMLSSHCFFFAVQCLLLLVGLRSFPTGTRLCPCRHLALLGAASLQGSPKLSCPLPNGDHYRRDVLSPFTPHRCS